MAQRSKLAAVLNGLVRNVDLTADELVVSSITLGGLAGTNLTKAALDSLISNSHASSSDNQNIIAGSGLSGGGSGASVTLDVSVDNSTLEIPVDTLQVKDGGITEAKLNSGVDAQTFDATHTAVNYTPSAVGSEATTKISAHLKGIDTALSAAASNEFSDDVFRIKDDATPTKKIAFQASGITAATTRTITMPDADVDLGGLTNSNISASAAIALSKLAALTASRALVSDGSGVISVSSVTSTELGYLSGATSSIQTQLNTLSSSIQNFEWQPSAKDYIVDNTALPPTEVTGDRYILSHDGGAPHANWDGAEAGDIVEFNGTVWVETDPSLGMFIGVDDDATGLYNWGGSSWSFKYFESTTASTGLVKVGFDIRLDSSSAGDGLGFSSGVLSVNVDNSTVELNTDALRVKAAGITESHLNTSVAGNGLSGGGGSALAVGAGTGIQVNANDIEVLYSPLVKKSMVAGEVMAANTSFLVRFAISGETAGRVYKADKDASVSDKFYAIGISLKTSAVSAGDPVDVIFHGSHTLGSSDTAFGAGDVGKAVYLTASGAFSITAPSATNEASYRIGMVEATNKIWVGDKQLNGIN